MSELGGPKRLKAKANPIVKAFLQRCELQLSAYIERFIDERGPSPDAFSSSPNIGLQSGAISRALIPNQRGHIGRYDVPTGEGLNRAPAGLVYGIDPDVVRHAAAQEFGKRVTATPRMIGFFWARFIETGFEKWKWIALSAKKKGHIDIKERSYYRRGIEAFEREGLPKQQAKLRDELVAAFNGGA
jgi:hypothetical protein